MTVDDPLTGTVTLNVAGGLRVRQTLLALEGDAFDAEFEDNGDYSEVWHVGLCLDRVDDTMTFVADGVHAIAVLEAAVRFPVAALPAAPARPAPGRYVYFGTGYGVPEVQRLVGPVTDHVLAAFAHGDTCEDLGLLLAPSSTYTGAVVGNRQRPRVLAVLEDLGALAEPVGPYPLETLLSLQTSPALVQAAAYVVDALVKDNARVPLIDHAVSRLELVRLRKRVAEGLLAYCAS